MKIEYGFMGGKLKTGNEKQNKIKTGYDEKICV